MSAPQETMRDAQPIQLHRSTQSVILQDGLEQWRRDIDELTAGPTESTPESEVAAAGAAESAKIVPFPAPKVDRTREYQEEAARGRVLDRAVKKVDTDVDFDESKLTPPPVNCLPMFMRKFVKTAALAAESDERLIVPYALLALAGAIGSTVELVVKPGHREPAVLWVAVIAQTGASKSPALHHTFAPITEWMKEEGKIYEEAKKRYDLELEEWRSTPRAERTGKPLEPKQKKLKVNDATIEALAPAFHENPRGLVWVSDELLGLVGGFNQYKGGHGSDRARMLELWNCKPTTILRAGREYNLNRPALSVGGGIQPDVLHELSPNGREDGFFERLLMVLAKSAAPPNNREGFDPEPAREWDRVLRLVIDGCESRRQDEVVTSRFDPVAQERWFDLSDEHRAEMRKMPARNLGEAKKIEAYAARLALVLHVARYFAREVSDLGELDVRDVESGWALARWFEQDAFLARGFMTITEEDQLVDKAVTWIRNHGGQATLRELQMGKALGRGVTKTEMQAVLDRAQETGIVTATQGEKDRRTVIYGLVPG